MGKLHLSLGTIALAAWLTGCSSDAATAPPATTSTFATQTSSAPATSPSPTPPVAPDAAKAHTEAGAEAFVAYYVALIDYAEKTLDTKPLASASLPSCVGCQGGIRGLNQVAEQGGRIEGSNVHATSVTPNAMTSNGSVSVFFTSVNSREMVIRPSRPQLIHPAAANRMVMTLVWQEGGWYAAQYEAWK